MRAVRWSSGTRVTRPGCVSARGTYKSKHSCGSHCRKSSIGRNLNAIVHLNARQNVFLRAKCPTEPGQLSIYQEELSSRLAIAAKACGMHGRRLSPAPYFVLHVRAMQRYPSIRVTSPAFLSAVSSTPETFGTGTQQVAGAAPSDLWQVPADTPTNRRHVTPDRVPTRANPLVAALTRNQV